MGNCGVDPAKQLIQEYGDDVGKLVALEKSKRIVEENAKAGKEETNRQTEQLKNNFSRDIERERK